MPAKTRKSKTGAAAERQRRSLQAVVGPLLLAGGCLSNIAYNAAQRDDVPDDIKAALKDWQPAWDSARRKIPKWLKAQWL